MKQQLRYGPERISISHQPGVRYTLYLAHSPLFPKNVYFNECALGKASHFETRHFNFQGSPMEFFLNLKSLSRTTHIKKSIFAPIRTATRLPFLPQRNLRQWVFRLHMIHKKHLARGPETSYHVTKSNYPFKCYIFLHHERKLSSLLLKPENTQ